MNKMIVWWRNAPSVVGKGPSSVGTPKILIISHAANSFYSAVPTGTPKLRFYPTVATIFIIPKGGDTQILILSYRFQ
jgi:hypothetical protein